MEDSIILQMREITKVFPGVRALDGVTLEVRQGVIHSICGENGAGKSTLMKVLSGVYPYGSYEGQIIYRGEEARFKSIKESENAGIVIIHQELTMIPELSITENIFMGNEIVKHGLIDWEEARRRTMELLDRVGLKLNPNTLIKNLGIFAIAFFAYAQLSQHKRVNELHVDKEPVWPVAVCIGLGTAAIGYITWLYGTSFPIPGLILVILVAIYHTVTQKTRFGRYIYAVGGNKNAAALSGVNVQKTYFLTMLNMSFLAALAGIMFVGRSTAAGPSDGTGWEMDAIASVYIGGAPASNQPVTFTDVQLGTWYYDTVAWVSENGITNGLGNGTFGVDAACTHCQVVTFLYAAYSN